MNPSFIDSALAWRRQAEADLCAEDGWLAVCGLHWLQQGENTFGADARCDLQLPCGPQHAGAFVLRGNEVMLDVKQGVTFTINGAAATSQLLRDDASGAADKLRLGSVSMMLLRRGERVGVRVWDNGQAQRANFGGRIWFAPAAQFYAQAKFLPDARPIKITNVLGDVSDAISPGWLEFELLGETRRLSVESSDIAKSLFINFRDGTSGKTSYGAGRFLYTGGVVDGHVMLDFNRAVSPPCAFTAFATCPLPRRENILTVAIEAGERYAAT